MPKQDRMIGIGILVTGAILLWRTFTFKPTYWDLLGMAFWPRVLIAVLCLIAVYFVLRGTVDSGPFKKLDWRGFPILLVGVVYVLLLEVVGFLILTPPFLFAAVLVLGQSVTRKRLVEAGLVAVLATGIVFVTFQKGLLVQLPEGLLY